MRTRSLFLLAVCGLLAALPATVVAQPPPSFPEDTVSVGLSGSATPNTAVTVELSQVTFADGGADAVLIGRDDIFADSLASGVAQDEGPLLLVPSAGPVPAEVTAEIDRLAATRAIIFGGENAVAPAVADALTAQGLDVLRLAGPSRVETAVEVARSQAPAATTAILARADGVAGNPTSGFADAMAAGGWSASTGWPVLLTQTEVLSVPTREHLVAAGIIEVKVMGGTAAVADAVVTELAGLGIDVERIAGADRAATAVETAKARGATTAADVSSVIVVDGFAEDAWAAGFAAAARSAGGGGSGFAGVGPGAPIVLGNVDGLPPATQEWLVPGPEALTCAVAVAVCEQARLALGFPAALQVEVPPGAITFTVDDGGTGAVYAADPDGSLIGLATRCEIACSELEWTASGAFVGVDSREGSNSNGNGQVTVYGGVVLSRTEIGAYTADPTSTFEMSDAPDLNVYVTLSPSGANIRVLETTSGGSGGSARNRFPSFQSLNRHPGAVEGIGLGWLMLTPESQLMVREEPTNGNNVIVDAHVQRRAGAQVLGAAWPDQGTGDIALTDVIGGEGLLRIAPYDDGEVVEADGVDATNVPYWLPDGETVVVLADTADGVSLVAVDAATGDAEVLVEDAGDAAGERVTADGSGTFVSWRAGGEIRVVDTRDGSVATITPPDGTTLSGGPAIRP